MVVMTQAGLVLVVVVGVGFCKGVFGARVLKC